MAEVEPMIVTLYPATCLVLTAIFLVFFNRASISRGLSRCAQVFGPENHYVGLRDTGFEVDADLEHQWKTVQPRKKENNTHWPTAPTYSSSTAPSYPSTTSTDDPGTTPLARYFDLETGAIYPRVLEPPTLAWEVELRMHIERGVGFQANWDRAVDYMVGLFVGLHV
ncbi:hypothetical protein BDV26DRAFT_284431 [Aspergillus bertholletiae]|uniref:Uncharacterized protein n=1 Tax=Aspergillus bertholletiae TaxID=1226010 RepID=A0A5N7AWJ1_9EURO|nr:hypothetical protein BDV26DRAFT_284431 [Aspergillus bertholletiae]